MKKRKKTNVNTRKKTRDRNRHGQRIMETERNRDVKTNDMHTKEKTRDQYLEKKKEKER